MEAGRDIIRKAACNGWFDWTAGSTLVFWRWPFFSNEARDGFPLYLIKNIKQVERRVISSILPKDEKLRKLCVEKIRRIVFACYARPGFAKWDIRCFRVPKGENDILVHDGTESGVNLVAWIPSFFLSTSFSLCRILVPQTYQMDEDAGEMFVNYPIRASFRPCCGLNLTKFTEIKDFLEEL